MLIAQVILEPHAFRGTLLSITYSHLYRNSSIYMEIPIPSYIKIKSQKILHKSFVYTKQEICVVICI